MSCVRFPCIYLSYLTDLCHFCLVDVSIFVYIKEREGPLQFPCGLPSRGHVQCNDVFFEVQGAIIIGVKGAKHMACVALGIAFWEKSCVDLLKLFWCYAPCRALLLKVFVPLADLVFSELGVELQVFQDLL